MCPLDIPHSFVPGTKAKANEVNANFNSIKTFVDANEVNIAQNELSISGLQENKADLNGAIENKFQVANPTGNYDAVNKQTLASLTANTRDYIGGFKLTKYDDYTITADPGNAWDSTYTYMFNQPTALQVTQSNLGNNATWYVYIVGGENFTNELFLSASNVNPGVEGKVFRLLGSFTTDDEGKILLVYSDSNMTINMVNVFTAMMPDWNKREARSANVTYTATVPGWVQWECNEQDTTQNLYINNVVVARVRSEGAHDKCGTGALVPVTIGDTYRCTKATMAFYPMRGL